MGNCNNVKNINYPTLLCYFEIGNEEQKNYCLKLKDNFHHEKTIRFEILSRPDINFTIKFMYNKKVNNIQDFFINTDEAMNQALEQMYKLLDESK